ncbi:hypothetical protein MVEG_10764 [Podila verticillata NRRL 6337]|nr:hypothetical protein MVEG_10764 [Podila verticillata NRRL 6337]
MGDHCIEDDTSNDYEFPMVQGLYFTLESGVDQPVSLKNLEWQGSNHTVQNISLEDAWISNALRKLEYVYGK